eukprot:m.274322 g.274322  ORF g.274322 m.274322 type:complete len:66 (-) comp17685_c0_seq5:4948-5145(-)
MTMKGDLTLVQGCVPDAAIRCLQPPESVAWPHHGLLKGSTSQQCSSFSVYLGSPHRRQCPQAKVC